MTAQVGSAGTPVPSGAHHPGAAAGHGARAQCGAVHPAAGRPGPAGSRGVQGRPHPTGDPAAAPGRL